MVERLVGLPFILIASPVMTIMIMALWYSFRANPENARMLSCMSIFLTAPVIAVITIPWRWGDIGDHPAAGLPFLAAFYEMFWIWCGSLVCMFVLDSPFAKFFRKRRAEKEIDPETFE